MEYSYKVYDEKMEVRQGKIKSSNMRKAKMDLQAQGYRIIHIREVQKFQINLASSGKFQTDEMSLLFQEMALYIEAGLEIYVILNLVSENYRGVKKVNFSKSKTSWNRG